MIRNLRAALSNFRRDEAASLVAEAILILPALVWWYVGIMVFFQGFEARSVNIKAAYTIADLISREDDSVDANYLNGLDKVFAFLVAGHGDDTQIRVTLVRCAKKCKDSSEDRTLNLDWSYGTGSFAPLTEDDLTSYNKEVPLLAKGVRAIILETWTGYTPAWQTVGLEVSEFTNTVVTRPRFSPTIPFETNTDANDTDTHSDD